MYGSETGVPKTSVLQNIQTFVNKRLSIFLERPGAQYNIPQDRHSQEPSGQKKTNPLERDYYMDGLKQLIAIT